MNGVIVEKVTRFLKCPTCQEPSFSVGHLPAGQDWGPWYCDECGHAVRGTVLADGGYDVTPLEGHQKVDRYVLLRRGDMFIVVTGLRFIGKDASRDQLESDRYFYKEHTCPTNYLRVEAVICEGDTDPHGVFDFVAAVDVPDGVEADDVDWVTLFPMLEGK